MGRSLKMCGLVPLVGALMMAIGCGGGGDGGPIMPSATASFSATVNPDGSSTTGPNTTVVATPPGTPGYLAGVSVTLPPNTTITARNADGSTMVLTATPSFTFIAPADSTATFSGTIGVPKSSEMGDVEVAFTSGAVDIQLTGAATATFDPAVTIKMPAPGKAVGEFVSVYNVRGTTYSQITRRAVTTAGSISFPGSSFSWKVGDPLFPQPDGTYAMPGRGAPGGQSDASGG
jgi:hypothetical protein